MFALVDVTSMYASVEKIYNPNLRNKPVMVLSNNDGCVVAACPIAKRLGFKTVSYTHLTLPTKRIV